MMKRLGILLGFLFLVSFVFGQVTVTGTITFEEIEEPVIGASIVVEGDEGIGTISDFDGTFELSVDSLPIALKVSYTGYNTELFLVSDNTPADIILKETDGIVFWCTFGGYVTDHRLVHSANYNKLEIEELKIGNSSTVLSAMNTTPGVHIHSGALNTNRITIRGIGNRSPFSTTKLRAYLDEIPLTSGVGETTIEDIDMDMLDYITIVKGPNTSNYGSGLGGSIIMKTDHNTKDYASTAFEAGSYGYYRTSNAINLTTQKATFRANYNFTHHDGYRDNNEYNRHNFSLLNKTDYSDKGKLTFLLNYTDLKAFIPSSLNEEDYLNEPSKAAFTWNKVKGFEDYNKIQIGASHNYEWNSNLSNTSSIFGTFFDSYESRPFNILSENSTALGARTRFNYNFDLFRKNHLFNFGAEYFNEKYDWQTYKTIDGILGEHLSDNIETRQYFNIFSELDLELYENLTLETGINFNSTRYNLQDFFFLDSTDISGKYKFNLMVSPRIGINYYWSGPGLSFFANVSHGFSPPSLEETLTPDGAINPNIRPEQGWNYEIGSRGNLYNGFKYSVSFYYMDVKDLLVAKRLELDQYIGINAGRTSHLGLELDLNYSHRFENWTLDPFLNYNFAHYTFNEFIDEDNDYSGNELTGNIPHKINSGIKIDSKIGLYGNVIYQFVDRMPMRDDNSIYSDSYQTVDMKIGFEKWFKKSRNNKKQEFQLDVYAGIKNLANEKYASQILINAGSFGGNAPRYYYPGLPRNYYAGVSLKYHW